MGINLSNLQLGLWDWDNHYKIQFSINTLIKDAIEKKNQYKKNNKMTRVNPDYPKNPWLSHKTHITS